MPGRYAADGARAECGDNLALTGSDLFESVEYVEAGREDEKSHPECLKVTLRPDDDFIDKNKTKGKVS